MFDPCYRDAHGTLPNKQKQMVSSLCRLVEASSRCAILPGSRSQRPAWPVIKIFVLPDVLVQNLAVLQKGFGKSLLTHRLPAVVVSASAVYFCIKSRSFACLQPGLQDCDFQDLTCLQMLPCCLATAVQ